MKRKQESLEERIKGLVSPVAWDENGKAIAACIVTNRGQGYFVDPDAKLNLLNYLKKDVVVTGIVSKKNGRRHVVIRSVANIENPDTE